MSTTKNDDQVETVEERTARYEAEYDARDLAVMLAQAHALHAATSVRERDRAETVGERAARYEAEYDARELALMLAQAHALHAADTRERNNIAGGRNTLAAITSVAAIAALLAAIFLLCRS